MEIKNFEKGNEFQILELFNLVFKRPMNIDYWYWRFENNPAGKHMIKLMWDGDKLIGHYAVSPVFLKVNGDNVLSTLSMTTMTHPDYGGRGIFGILANSLYKDLENKYNVKAIWGFPNNNSHYGFIKNLKWKDLGVISHLSKQAKDIHPKLSDKIFKSNKFSAEHDEIFQKTTQNFNVSINRNTNYLNWRYLENPNVKYDIFDFKENSLKATIVTKLYPTSNGNVKNIFITECGIPLENMDLLPEILSHIKAYYDFEIETINVWLPIFDKRYIFFEKNSFLIGGNPTYIGIRAENKLVNTLSDIREWYFSYGDSDVY